jgi:predicted GNAT family N-acyltransferase
MLGFGKMAHALAEEGDSPSERPETGDWQGGAAGTDWVELPQGRVSLHRVAGPHTPEFAELCRMVCRETQYWRETQFAAMNDADAKALLATLPAPARGEQKYLWAVRRDEQLVGCLDVTRHWPTHHTVTIGFLMISATLRGLGLGRATLQELARRTRAWPGVRRWRIAVVESQAGARRFWKSQGFMETGQRHQSPSQRAPQLVMERVVGR